MLQQRRVGQNQHKNHGIRDQNKKATFRKLKEALISGPVRAYSEFQQPFELHTDKSLKGLGPVLYKTQDCQKRVIAYASRNLSRAEKKYSARKLEFLVLKWAASDKFSDYLMLNKFSAYTDNNPLTHVLASAKLDATGQRPGPAYALNRCIS